jgi:hypothetical protein
MGGCHSEHTSNHVNNIKKSNIDLKPEFFSRKGEKLSDLKCYEDSPSQNIEIFLFLKDVESAIYEIDVLLKTGNIDTFLGKTKEIQGNNIDFMTSFSLNYYFEKEQTLTLIVNKNRVKSDVINTNVGKIMGSLGQREVISFHNKGNLTIQACNIKNDSYYAEINVTLNINRSNKIDPFYYFKRNISKGGNIQFVKSYKSEVLICNSTHQYNFSQVTLETIALNDNDYNKAFLIEVYDSKNMGIIGYQNIVLNQFNENNNHKQAYQLLTPNTNIPLTDCSIDIKVHLTKKYRFIDYLAGGLQISLIVGIDFTSSNKPITDTYSLHYINSNYHNGYEKAILSCGNIVGYYDYDQKFPVFGYGAKLPGSDLVDHCFPINFELDPNIYSIQNVLLAYRSCVQKIRMFGPTYFAPIIRQTINISKMNNKNNYYILMILTDGQINDIQDTIDTVVEASYLNISIIIIGIGDGKFENMELLDADINPLKSSTGANAIRDIVQFVEFRVYENNGVILAEQVLEEVPTQIEEYYRMIKQPPNQPLPN